MSLSSLFSQTVTIVHISEATYTTDAEGNATGTPPTQDYPGLIQQRDATEVIVGPDTLISDHLLFLGADAQISGGDQVIENGRRFTVIGEPARFDEPFMSPDVRHIEAHLKLVTN